MTTLLDQYTTLIRRGMPLVPFLVWPEHDDAATWFVSSGVGSRLTDITKPQARAMVTAHATAWVQTVEHKTLGGLDTNSLEWVLAVTKDLEPTSAT